MRFCPLWTFLDNRGDVTEGVGGEECLYIYNWNMKQTKKEKKKKEISLCDFSFRIQNDEMDFFQPLISDQSSNLIDSCSPTKFLYLYT